MLATYNFIMNNNKYTIENVEKWLKILLKMLTLIPKVYKINNV